MYFSNKNSFNGFKWKIKSFDEKKVLSISQQYGLSQILSILLSIKNIDDVNNFLEPKLKNFLKDPNHLLDMEKGVDVIYNAIINNEKITIYGDYDTDGITSSVLLKNFFNYIKVKSSVYIPDRIEEGYGLNKNAIKYVYDNEKPNLIITVDCGISSFDEVSYAKELGMKIIITDHHLPNDKLPLADAVIDPKRLDETTEYTYLAGVAVAFLFLISLNRKLRISNYYLNNAIEEPNLIDYIDLVAIGTVGDLMSLINLNRAIVFQGINHIKKTKNLGIKSLIDVSTQNSSPFINAEFISYVLSPKINSVGRIANANKIINLFTTEDPNEANELAKYTLECNESRKELEDKLFLQVETEIINNKLYEDDVIFIINKNLHEGLIGVIASKIKEKYEKVVFIITEKDNYYKGSCRSIINFDIGTIILESKSKNLLLSGGGHPMAGGFALEKSNIDEFKKFVITKYNEWKDNNKFEKEREIDLLLEPKSLNLKLALEIEKLSPFGSGNERPIICLKDVYIKRYFYFDTKNIIRLILSSSNSSNFNDDVEAVMFKIYKNNSIIKKLKNDIKISVIGTIQINIYHEKKSIQFIIKDIMF